MNPILFNIYGPISIHAYGLCITIGALISFYLLINDRILKRLLPASDIATIIQIMIAGGYFGGRLILMISEPETFSDPWFILKFWEPGFSILGSIIGILISLLLYLYVKRIPILKLIDRFALYAPLVQMFGRVGCFFAGCCYGKPTEAWYGVTYTHPNHMAPLNCALHPAQLYSAIFLMGIFLFLYFIVQNHTQKAGILFCIYLFLAGAERFLIDFIRWDKVFLSQPDFLQIFSIHQWIALAISFGALFGIFIIRKLNR